MQRHNQIKYTVQASKSYLATTCSQIILDARYFHKRFNKSPQTYHQVLLMEINKEACVTGHQTANQEKKQQAMRLQFIYFNQRTVSTSTVLTRYAKPHGSLVQQNADSHPLVHHKRRYRPRTL